MNNGDKLCPSIKYPGERSCQVFMFLCLYDLDACFWAYYVHTTKHVTTIHCISAHSHSHSHPQGGVQPRVSQIPHSSPLLQHLLYKVIALHSSTRLLSSFTLHLQPTPTITNRKHGSSRLSHQRQSGQCPTRQGHGESQGRSK